MERGKTLVIDASIAVKWFNLEEYSEVADKLKVKHINGEVTLVAPVLIVFEVTNALRYSPDFGVEDLKNAVNDLLDLQIVLCIPEKEWMEQALENAYRLGITVYDACYIALAKHLKSSVYTADKRLKDKVEDVSLKHISEFRV